MKFLTSVFLLSACMAMVAQDIPQPMQPPRMVNDFSGLLSTDEQNQLEQVLQTFYYETSSQIYIVILDDLQGYDIAEYSQMLGEKWGVGTRGRDNGIVILVNPSPDRQRGKAFIATGYGLEGAVPDALANRIVDLDMVPYFKQQQYFNGLMAASKSIMELARGEYTADEYLRSRAASQGSNIPLVPVIIFFVILFSIIGRSRTTRSSSLGRSLPFWAAMFMLGSNRHSSHSGKFGNFSSGSGSFGGFGGFGGGGGGHFGGGGAGGSW